MAAMPGSPNPPSAHQARRSASILDSRRRHALSQLCVLLVDRETVDAARYVELSRGGSKGHARRYVAIAQETSDQSGVVDITGPDGQVTAGPAALHLDHTGTCLLYTSPSPRDR